ncbi:MAG: hypothetical protein VKK42_26510 [Lyngbya sp.]|nr:hypothetical protein [Lyngbya sp.]
MVWEGVELDENLLELLKLLCDNVTYLGRAESWCELSVSQSNDSQIDCNVKPLDGGKVTTDETVRLLAPLSGEGLVVFQQAIAAVPKPKRAKWQVPQDVLEALEVDIGDLHRQGWSGVTGARWVTYTLAKTFPESGSASPSDNRLFTVARFDFRGKVLPPLTEALAVGERFRQALICRSNKFLGNAFRHATCLIEG